MTAISPLTLIWPSYFLQLLSSTPKVVEFLHSGDAELAVKGLVLKMRLFSLVGFEESSLLISDCALFALLPSDASVLLVLNARAILESLGASPLTVALLTLNLIWSSLLSSAPTGECLRSIDK